ncbi:hypothetical protein [Porphyromonas loveana]|uniref:Uncharacterized protein n=1 Tax=Porphyromonas loveana TaxID=1884669 RepID=A0A2U1FFN6_9PORP|nr:hypothetical protein [Porphyromonas loveana]PVZ10780.1 hypothetical protein C7382_107146 [Porphyromonas loveana]
MEKGYDIFSMKGKTSKRLRYHVYVFFGIKLLIALVELLVTESPFVIIPLLSLFTVAGVNFIFNIVHERQVMTKLMMAAGILGICTMVGLDIFRYFSLLIERGPL